MTRAVIGLMSGTSLDGVDGVLGLVDAQGGWQGTLAHAYEPFPASLRAELLALNTAGPDELHRAALAGQAVAQAYAQVVAQLRSAPVASSPSILAIGAHGQTVRHRPDCGYTLQLLAPALLAELTGLNVVTDFRSRDIAAGGQGAPLVPIFHQAVLASDDHPVAVLNVGGIANVSLLTPGQPPMGFDCGPGNVLMDLWCQQHLDQPFDANGHWAATGHVQQDWLDLAIHGEPYFQLRAPKSTGRDLFHADWLKQWLARCGLDASQAHARAADVQATLCALTARSCAEAITQVNLAGGGAAIQEVLVCGGGALNAQLMRALSSAMRAQGSHAVVQDTHQRGLPPMQVEAAAFAWLAWAAMNRRPGNVPRVTGAAGERVLGAIYPA